VNHSDRWVNVLLSVGAAIAVALILGGCGGTGSSDPSAGTVSKEGEVSSASSPSPTKAEFIKRGDAICRKTDTIQKESLDAYTEQHPGEIKSVADQEKIIIQVALPPIKTEIQELAALGAPKGDEAKIQEIISGLEDALQAAERAPLTLLGTEGEGEFAKPDKLAESYGFVDCAKAL
jgi:hypothetical protein